MSKRRQENAAQRRDAARQRARSARMRAQHGAEQGERMLARLHDDTAALQDDAADRAEGSRLADVALEGDQLDGRGEEPAAPPRKKPPAARP